MRDKPHTKKIFLTKLKTFLTMTSYFFLIRMRRGGVHLGPLGTGSTNWRNVPALIDYEDGEFGGRCKILRFVVLSNKGIIIAGQPICLLIL
jgi:hypothetical protein